MKLNRGFLDVKRLAQICFPIGFRKESKYSWIKDYLATLVSPLQDTNNDEIEFEHDLADYVKYNGQTLSVKTLVDDYCDPAQRRTLIRQNDVYENIVFTGYYNGDINTDYSPNNFVKERDIDLLTLSGYLEEYTDGTSEWVLEDLSYVEEPPIVYGYYSGNIHDEYSPSKFIKEAQPEAVGVTILIHNDIWANLGDTRKDYLYTKLSKLIPFSTNFELKGYECYGQINGISDDDYFLTSVNSYDNVQLSTKIKIDSLPSYAPIAIGLIGAQNNPSNTSNFIMGITFNTYTSEGLTNYYLMFRYIDLNDLFYFNSGTIPYSNVAGFWTSDTFIINNAAYNSSVSLFDNNTNIYYNYSTVYNGVPSYITGMDKKIKMLCRQGTSTTTSNEDVFFKFYWARANVDGVNYYFNVHPDGYLFDNFGNIYYNRESATNEYPLETSLTEYN